MEDPKEVDDTLYIVEVLPRQVGRVDTIKEWIAALDAQGKRVVVIGVDSPRPPLLGAAMVHFGDPDMHVIDTSGSHFQDMLKEARPKLYDRPIAGKTMLLSSLDRMFPMEESKDAMFDRFMTSMMMPSREWLDPIPKAIVKKEKNKLGFLDGLGYKKRKYGNQK